MVGLCFSGSRTITRYIITRYLSTASPKYSTYEFREAYGHYTQGGQTSYQPEGSTGYGHDQGFYYPSGMGTSHGPQVGSSVSARFEYDNPLTQGLSDLTARVSAMELR